MNTSRVWRRRRAYTRWCSWASSPRGALAVCRMAKAYAYVQGRDYAMPEDVAAIFPDVCCHRLMLSTKARMMERSAAADRG
ncbi:MAG: hypothetical protein ACLS3C_07570 [Oscillospiraceae bacterium]